MRRLLPIAFAALVLVACSDVKTERVGVTLSSPAAAFTPDPSRWVTAAEDIRRWDAVVLWNATVTWDEAIAAQERALQARVTASKAHKRVVTPMSSTGRYSGSHSDAWWHGVAVCEQGGRNDPFFGYFSIMNGSAGGLDWSTQVAMANGIISRYGDGAWAASCVRAGYAASSTG